MLRKVSVSFAVTLLVALLAVGVTLAGTVLLHEDYSKDKAEGVGGWEFWNGAPYSVSGGLFKAGNNDDNPDWFAVTGDAGWTDYAVEVSVGNPDGHNTGDIRTLARVQDKNNYYDVRLIYGGHNKGPAYAGLPTPGDAVLYMTKVVDGKPTLLAQASKNVPDISGDGSLAGKYIDFQFEVVGSHLAVYADTGSGWTKLAEATDDTFKSGKVGIGQGEYPPAWKSVSVLKR